jgi:hypothetical protein
MEKGFRLVQCPSCPATLRLKISEQHYNKRIEITCPKCFEEFRTTIPTPADYTGQATPQPSFAETLSDLFDLPFGKPGKK